MIFYFRYEKERVERERIAEQSKGVGRPKVGGQFELQNQGGEVYTDEQMKGGFSLVWSISHQIQRRSRYKRLEVLTDYSPS